MVSDQLVFRSSSLQLDDLVCLRLASTRSQDATVSDFTQTTLRCRQIIFEFSGKLLACPRTEDSCVLLVCPSRLVSCPKFAARCEKVKLPLASRSLHPLSPALLEECLAYTLKARLAPNWNKVGDWFLAGRQFLHQADQIPAVKMSLHLADRQVVFVLSATVMRFPLLQPEDLGVATGSLEQFILGDQNSCIQRSELCARSVLVLPKLTRGALVSITKQLPAGSRFQEWSAMKRYWKNMYGYRLEQEDGSEPTVYYNVSFGPGPPLTYPEWTVRASAPRPVARVDPRPVVQQFLAQLQASSATLCGQAFSVNCSVSVARLEAVRPSPHSLARLPGLQDLPGPSLPYRSQGAAARPGRNHTSDWSQGGREDSGYDTASHVSGSTGGPDLESSAVTAAATGLAPRLQAPASRPTFGSSAVPPPVPRGSVSTASPRPLPQGPRGSLSPTQAGDASAHTYKQNIMQDNRPPAVGKVVPSFASTKAKPTFLSRMVSSQNRPHTFGPRLPTSKLPAQRLPTSRLPTSTLFPSRLPTPGLFTGSLPTTSPHLPSATSFPAYSPMARPLPPSPMRPPFPPSSPMRPPLPPSSPRPSASPSTPQSARKKPAVQEVDFPKLVQQEGAAGLAKINVVTLLDHLKKQGVQGAKAKSKKEELVQMVLKLHQ